MRLAGWHIDGFGIHRDWHVSGLSDGLNLFYGPNEAGKSTLLAFLRGVLFGYPDGRSNEPKYAPKGGGAHGGRVFLRGVAGEIVVERFAGRGQKVSVTLEDGRPGDEAALAVRLGHADARLFRTVFAFGLPELQKLGSLGEAGIQDHILAAGVTGGGRSAREAVQELRNAARDLFDGPKGRKKSDRARVLVREIAELNGELFVRQEAAERYPDLCDLEQALASRMRELEAEVEDERAAARRARRLVELWNEVWTPLVEAREQIAKLAPSRLDPAVSDANAPGSDAPGSDAPGSDAPGSDALLVDARERLEHWLKLVQRDEERLEVLRAERSAVAGQLSELRLDEPARAVAARVAGLQDRLALHRSQCARRDELETRMAACADRVGSVLERLFPGPPDEGSGTAGADGGSGAPGEGPDARLRAVQSTAQRRDELRAWKAQVDACVAELRDAEAAVRLLVEQRDAAQARVRALDERAGGEAPVDTEALARRQDAVRALRVASPRLRELERELAARTEALARQESEGGMLGAGSGSSAVLAVALALLTALVGGVGGALAGRPDLSGVAAVLGAAVVAVALARGRSRRKQGGAARAAVEEAALDTGRRLESARAEAAPHVAVLAEPDAGLSGPDAGGPGAADLWSEEGLARAEGALDAARQRLEAERRRDDEVREARNQLQGLEARRSDELEWIARGRERQAAVEADFGRWKAEVGLPSALGVDAAAEFLDEARRGRDAMDERDHLSAESRRVAAEIATWRADVDAVLAEVGVGAGVEVGADSDPGDDEARIAALAVLRDRCAADRAAREGRDPLERRAAELRDRFAALEAELASSRAGLTALLREAGVADVPALQRAIGLAAEAAALEERVAAAEAELQRRLADLGEAEAAALRDELATGAVDVWQERATRAEARVARIRDERDGVLREHQDRARDRQRLEESTDVMELELRKSALEEELRTVLDDWRRLRLAARVLEEALARFEEAHQPGVLREASALFSRVTAGRYPRIVPEEGETFAVVAADGTHRSPAELSQGTTEQLYLCIRLGLVAELARNERALPVVMDDVLVNFDDARAAAMAEVLAAFAREHQLLFFTCSSRTRDLLAAAAPEAGVRSIGLAPVPSVSRGDS